MSRYVDLDGNTWDGRPITSKIQEVLTKHGYMSAITTGWLFGDNVPHLDLEEHDAKIRAETIDKYKNELLVDIETRYKQYLKILGYVSADNLMCEVHNAIEYFAEQLKENNNALHNM